MHIVELASIVLGDRQRTVMDKQKLFELKTSILDIGLLHAPVVQALEDGTYKLIAGERRYRAIQQISEEGKTFRYNADFIYPDQIPVTLFDETLLSRMFAAELDENVLREDLSWQDKAKALAYLHALKKQENPDQTYNATAVELSEASKGAPNTSVSHLREQISDSVLLAKALDDPEINNARTQQEALTKLYKREEDKYQAELIQKRGKLVASKLSVVTTCGDALKLIPTLPDGKIDLILSDPPYGLNAQSSSYTQKTGNLHNYNDSPEAAQEILRGIVLNASRICKVEANMVLMTDIKFWPMLHTLAAQQGWSPWFRPIIWQRSASEGMAPWGRKGFALTYDVIFWATRGQRGTMRTLPDIITLKRVARTDRVFAAEKPVELMELFVQLMTLPGDLVFDPCMGSGTTLVAAKALRRNAIGYELVDSTFNKAVIRIEETTLAPEIDPLIPTVAALPDL